MVESSLCSLPNESDGACDAEEHPDLLFAEVSLAIPDCVIRDESDDVLSAPSIHGMLESVVSSLVADVVDRCLPFARMRLGTEG